MTLKRLTRINLKNATAYSVNVHGMFSSNLQAKEIREICNRVLIRAMCSSNWFSSNRQASFFAIRGIGNSRNTPITKNMGSQLEEHETTMSSPIFKDLLTPS